MATPAPDLIADIERALKAMTPGPLVAEEYAGYWQIQTSEGYGGTDILDDEADPRAEANARGIITLRNRVPELLALLRQAVPFAKAAARFGQYGLTPEQCESAAAWLAAVEGGAK